MRLSDVVRSLDTWTNNEEKSLLCKISELRALDTFTPHEKVIIEGLVRKSLLIKVSSKDIDYVYPNA